MQLRKAKPRTKAGDPVLGGRTKLMDAALQLAASTRSLASIGLREVARHAGVNPNTFYRHFKDFDELGLAVVQEFGDQLRAALRARRRSLAGISKDEGGSGVSPQRMQEIVHETVGLALDFITEHRTAYVVGIRELHGGSPVLRAALREVLDGLAREMAEDSRLLFPEGLLDDATLREISRAVMRQMSFLALDYLEQPEAREALRQEAEQFIFLVFLGALAAKNPGSLAASLSKFPQG